MKLQHIVLAVVAVVSVTAGLILSISGTQKRAVIPQTNHQGLSVDDLDVDTSVVGKRRPDFSLPDVAGQFHNISEWDGQVVAVNFWATWCLPCLKEIPELVDLQTKYAKQGLQIVGIALQRPDQLSAFILEYKMNYPILAGEEVVIEVAEQYGNNFGVLPYTAIIGRNGEIEFIKAGPVAVAEVEAVITKLL